MLNVHTSLLHVAQQVLGIGARLGLLNCVTIDANCEDLMIPFQAYLHSMKLDKMIHLAYDESGSDRIAKVVKPSSLEGSDAKITIYVSKRKCVPKSELEGLLAHEIGTHVIRMLNDDQSVWCRNNRKKYNLKSHQCSEEGLACLNALAVKTGDAKDFVLWYPALRYYACVLSQSMDPHSLSHALIRYIPNRESRERFCVRVFNRGNRDQAYFIGAIDILRHKPNFIDMYIGLLDRSDVARMKQVSSSKHALILPPFLNSKLKLNHHTNMIEEIAKINQINTLIIPRPVFEMVTKKEAISQH